MKNLNKVLAMLVVFMMVVSTVAFASSFTDVASTSSYNTAISVNADLGLITGYEDGTFKPEGEITRSEFAAIVVRLLGQEAQATAAASSTAFVDVPATHWAAGYVNIATQAGIIKGYGNGKFGPDDLVNYEDAITMVVRALGYEPAIGAAGYPTGYLTKAGELSLTSGVSGTNGVPVNRGTVAQIAFNALDVPLMTQSGYGTFTQYIPNDGTNDTVKKTPLSEYHSTVKVQGTVAEVKYKTTTSDTVDDTVKVTVTNPMKNRFGIGYPDKDGKETTVTMNIGSSDAAQYIGKKCVIFAEYDEFEDKCTVASIYEASNVDTMVIDLSDVDSVTANTIKYYNENNKLTTVTVANLDPADFTKATSKIYYNGVKGGAAKWADVKDLTGTIELSLMGATATTDYDTVYITAYSTFVVKAVRAASCAVTSKFTTGVRTIYFDPEDTSYKASLVSASGAAMDFADLEENDVLMVKYVNDGSIEHYDAYVVENTVTGTVTSLSGVKGGDDRVATIDGKDYDVAKGLENKTSTIKLGDEGTFYLDENDNIVYFDATMMKSDNYGYVIAADKSNGISTTYQVQIVGKDNSVTIYDLASKVKVGKHAVVDSKDTYVTTSKDDDDAYNDDLKGYVGLVTYKVNSANEVSAINFAVDASKNIDDVLTVNKSNKDAVYDADRDAFKVDGKWYYLTESTTIFNVAYEKDKDDSSKYNVTDDTEVIALTSFEDATTYKCAYIYDADEDDDTVGAIVFADKTMSNTFGAANEFATFVISAGETTDDEGDTVAYVKGYKGLEEVTYVSEDIVLSDAKAKIGTLVYPLYNADGTVKSFKATTEGTTTVATDKKMVVGKLADVDSDRDYITVGGNEYKLLSDTNIYVYDKVKASSRKPYEVGTDIYFTKDTPDDAKWGIYKDKDMINCDVTVYIYVVEDDVVDVVYYINSYSSAK